MAQRRSFSSDVESENPLDDVVIPLDGIEFRCEGRLGILQLSKLAAQALGEGAEDVAEAAAIYNTLRLAFGKPEYDRFEAHVLARNTPDEVIVQILQCINEQVQENLERITARPTKPSSSSSAGQSRRAPGTVRSVSLSKANLTADTDATATPTGTRAVRTAGTAKPAAKTRTARKTGSTARRTG